MSAILFAGLLASCASIPDVEYTYYPAKSDTTVTVTQAVACNSGKTALIITNSPLVTTTYSADRKSGPYHVRIKNIEGPYSAFADSDAKFTFYDDGRLETINQQATGQGGEIIKSAATLVTTIGSFVPAAKQQPQLTTSTPLEAVCSTINTWGNGKPVNLTYSSEDLSSASAPDDQNRVSNIRDCTIPVAGRTVSLDDVILHKERVLICPTLTSRPLYDALNGTKNLPPLYAKFKVSQAGTTRAQFVSPADEENGGFVRLTLQKMTLVTADVWSQSKGEKRPGVILTQDITVPEEKDPYILPIPEAAMFGMQKFSLQLSPAGAITSIEYGKNTGGAGALNAANAVAATQTPATKATQLRGIADQMAQQDRVTACLADSSQCK